MSSLGEESATTTVEELLFLLRGEASHPQVLTVLFFNVSIIVPVLHMAACVTIFFAFHSAWRLSHESLVVFGTTDRITKAGQVFKVIASENEDPLLKFGDGEITARYDVTVMRVDPLLDTVVGVTEFLHDYPAAGNYTASLTLCCRVAGHQNALKSMGIEAQVSIGAGSTGSPIFSMLPRIFLDATRSGVRKFRVSAISPQGRPLTYSLGGANQYGYRSNPPSSAIIQSIDPATGMMSVNVTCYALGTCPSADQNVVVVVSDGLTRSTVDFIVQMQQPLAEANRIPTITLSPGSLNAMDIPKIEAFVGFEVKFQFQARDDDTFQSVFFQYSIMPEGASVGPVLGVNPAVQDFTWLPSQDNIGTRFMCAAAMDLSLNTMCTPCDASLGPCVPDCPAFRASEMRCVEINVRANPKPAFVEPTITQLQVYMNQEVKVLSSTPYVHFYTCVHACFHIYKGAHPQLTFTYIYAHVRF